ncbi:MAG: cytochrome C [Candidatus Scalindua sp.]|jgi:hypothetical protein|nr:cytochrome C [Candidatus Scalindua sp.]|tara:strand:+ start:1087 stop:1914 length:828 start_codon:yes stop_codon:yes gene_type:complete
MPDKKETNQGRYRALAFVKGESLAKEKDLQVSEDELQTWPYLLRKEFLAAIIVMIILMIWSIALDAPLEEPSDPSLTPNPAKAPWYFLGLQEMLVYFDPWIAGVVFPSLIVMGLMVIPYVDMNPKGNGYYTFKERKFAILTFCFGFHVLWILLIIVGVFMRGPGWLWFWPWEEWDSHRIVADTNYDLTQFIGIDSKSLLGFIIGGGLVSIYFFLGMAVPYLLMKMKNSPILEKLGIIRYSIVAFLFLSMLGLPIKMVLKLVFHLKYIWVTPWFNI